MLFRVRKKRGAMEVAHAVVGDTPDIIDIRNNDEGTATLITNTAGKTFLVDIQPIVIPAGWKKSTDAPFRATHPAYLSLLP
jgi:hypothetical protein